MTCPRALWAEDGGRMRIPYGPGIGPLRADRDRPLRGMFKISPASVGREYIPADRLPRGTLYALTDRAGLWTWSAGIYARPTKARR